MSKLHIFLLTVISGSLILMTSCENNPVASTESTDVPKKDSTLKDDMPSPNLVVSIDTMGTLDTIRNQNSAAYKRVQFQSMDSLLIDANYYHVNNTAPSILLCHQARWNKYEYDSIAVVLKHKGYNCLATDQRSGGIMNIDNIQPVNATHRRAVTSNLPTDYLDAEQDIIAAIDYLYEKTKKPIILWGSSYSSTLALYNGLNNDKVAAVISFSPGNYFSAQKGSLIPLLETSTKPFFITSSQAEAEGVQSLLNNKKTSTQQVQFIPKADGHHGSRALWASKAGNQEYWAAIISFLESLN